MTLEPSFLRRWLRLVPWIGHRAERHPLRWAIGSGVLLVALVIVSITFNIPPVWR